MMLPTQNFFFSEIFILRIFLHIKCVGVMKKIRSVNPQGKGFL